MIYGDAVISCEKGSWSGIVTPECRPEEGMFDSKFFSFFHYEVSILTKVDPFITSNDSRSKRVCGYKLTIDDEVSRKIGGWYSLVLTADNLFHPLYKS